MTHPPNHTGLFTLMHCYRLINYTHRVPGGGVEYNCEVPRPLPVSMLYTEKTGGPGMRRHTRDVRDRSNVEAI